MIHFVDQSGQPGGAELCLADLAQACGKDGRVILFADGPFGDILRARGVDTRVIPIPGDAKKITKQAGLGALVKILPSIAAHVAALRREFRAADTLYFNTAKALVHGVAASTGLGQRRIFHLHDLLEAPHFSATNIRLLVAAANRANVVIANSRATRDAFLAAGGRPLTYVIPNGFDPRAFDLPAPERKEPFVAALFGRISRWKGQDVLIRAAAKSPGLTVWIVGEAVFTGDDHAYAEELRALVRELGLEDRVKFLGFRSDIPALMRAADLVVHSSVYPEPFGRVLVEAMLAEKPVIAAAAGGPLDIVEEGETGFLTPPGDVAALAAAIEKLADPQLRLVLGRNGRARAIQHYSLSAVIAQTRQVIAG